MESLSTVLAKFDIQFANEVEALEGAHGRDVQAYDLTKGRMTEAEYVLQRACCKRLFNQLYQFVEYIYTGPLTTCAANSSGKKSSNAQALALIDFIGVLHQTSTVASKRL